MSNSSIEHSRFVADLAEFCSKCNFTIYKHNYDYTVFGSWIMVIGRPHHRVKFSWDGKESYLGVSESEFKNQNSVPEWYPVEWGPGGTTLEQTDVFDFIKEHLPSKLAL